MSNGRTDRIENRLNYAAGSIDGVAAILQTWVQSIDIEQSRQAFAMSDLLERISNDLSQIAMELTQTAHIAEAG